MGIDPALIRRRRGRFLPVAFFRNGKQGVWFAPSPDISTTPAQFQLRFQEVHFVASDGTSLFGWWIPANRPRGTVVYCRGNAGNIGSSAHLAPEFTQRGFNLFLWDYRGYAEAALPSAVCMTTPAPPTTRHSPWMNHFP